MRLRFVLIAMLATASACGGKSTGTTTPAGPTAATAKPLYDRIGGMDAITAMVADVLSNVSLDARINTFFVNANHDDLKAKLSAQICELTGGPCKYTGKTMKEAHATMGVKAEHFDAFVEDVVKTFDKFKVEEPERTELLKALGAMKPEIVAQ